jgi:hypothetical protein
MINHDLLRAIQNDVGTEFLKASSKFRAFNSAHEGYAVLFEEVDELWEHVKLNQKNPNRQRLMKEECLHVAAMALRFLYDCCAEQWIPINEVNK